MKTSRLRSVNDYSSDEDIESALRGPCKTSCACSASSSSCCSVPATAKPQNVSAVAYCRADWFVPNCVRDSSIPQTVENELRRLKALKSFQILDKAAKSATAANVAADAATASSSEPVDVASTLSTMDHIVRMARTVCQTPMAALTLADMGRQCVMAQSGLPGDVPELRRREAICSHAILSKHDVFLLADATKDPRFGENVVPSFCRFYAGAPLITPEGDRIGSICVLGTEPRPEGLSSEQKKMLMHFSGVVMNALVERRHRLQQERKLKKATRVISSTVHDLLTPLTAVELALSLLHEDHDFQSKLLQHQKESIKIASNCIGVLGRMCRTMRDQHSASCRQQVGSSSANNRINRKGNESSHNPDFGLTAESFRIMYGSGVSEREKDDFSTVSEKKTLDAPRVSVVVKDLVKNIHMAMDAIPKTVPIAIALHSSVPAEIVTDDLKILRCALNLLQHCASIAKSGTIQLSIKAQYCKCGRTMVGFHCENRKERVSHLSLDQSIMDCCSTSVEDCSGSSTSTIGSDECCHNSQASQSLRSCSEINLYSVAMQVEAIGGDCGLQQDGRDSYWFRIPLQTPEEDGVAQPTNTGLQEESTKFCTAVTNESGQAEMEGASEKESDSFILEAQPRLRRALIIEDSLVIRKVIANALSKIGFETVTACNGMEGLQMLQSSLYDVVLCDFLMPVMDGLDCVQQYREWERSHRQWLRQYIIGMSAHASDKDVQRGLKAGMDSYKPKPLTYQGLKDLVDACEKNQQNLISNTLDRIDKNPLSSKIEKYGILSDGIEEPKMCLIASKDDTNILAQLAEAKGWKSLIVHDGEDALQALKKRNWNAVLLDEKLPLLAGGKCAAEFREWERDNRVNCQKNLIIMSSPKNLDEGDGEFSTVNRLVPRGSDGILNKPVQLNEFEEILTRAEKSSLNIIMR